MTAPPRRLEAMLRAFADRVFLTDGSDPGDAAVALPPARLDLYRELLRGNYRSMLRFAFTSAFHLMDHVLAEADGAGGLPADADAVIIRFLQVGPSRTHSTREIADRFLSFFPREYPVFAARRPDVLDLMRLERAELRAMFETDDPGRCFDADELTSLAQGSLDDLLALTIVRAPSASVLRLAHPVVALRAALGSGEAPVASVTAVERATVSRRGPPKFPIDFAICTEETTLVFESAVPGVPAPAETLAQAWFGRLPPALAARDDAWKASSFASAVIAGLASGVLRAD